VLACIVNVSEGRDPDVLAALTAAAGRDLLDLHADPHHNRCVLTLVAEDAPRAVATEAVRLIDLNAHSGAHPRIGVVDVVPFVPLDRADMDAAVAARDQFATWAGTELALPCFLYGPERDLPTVRRGAFARLVPDTGPPVPHPTAGAAAVGARRPLVAYNVWLAEPDIARAKEVAATMRSAEVRALGLQVGARVQVSMNLVEPDLVGPAVAFDRVAAMVDVDGAELVGLLSARVLDAVPQQRWAALDLAPDRTIEARLAQRG
jgi:glutamate formiminotransferase